MPDLRLNGQVDNKIELKLPVTGLLYNTSGLIISTRCDTESSPVSYTVASSNVEDITTLGTYAAPSTSKCRFKEIGGNHAYHYELQFLNSRFDVSNAKYVTIRISGAAGLPTEGVSYQIQLDAPINVGKMNNVQTPTPVYDGLEETWYIPAGLQAIKTNSTAAKNLLYSADSMIYGSVDNTNFTPTTTIFETQVVNEATADHFVDRRVIFTDGALIKQICAITAYELNAGFGRFTVTTLTDAPAHGDNFIIV